LMFLRFVIKLSSTSDKDIPKVFSTSYRVDPGIGPMAATRFDIEYMKAGARGISLINDSGDQGAAATTSTLECVDANGEHTLSPNGKYNPDATNVYVTYVGGTMPNYGFPKPGSEQVWNSYPTYQPVTTPKHQELLRSGPDIYPSGGFDLRIPRPKYQDIAITSFLKEHGDKLPPASKGYNTSHRAFPDVAAMASNFPIASNFGVNSGKNVTVLDKDLNEGVIEGTSAAAPTFAGLMALANDVRLKHGKSTLGFINPLLYWMKRHHPEVFHDITLGFGGGGCLVHCEGRPDLVCLEQGYPVVAGWNPATGLGTINWAKFVKVVLHLP